MGVSMSDPTMSKTAPLSVLHAICEQHRDGPCSGCSRSHLSVFGNAVPGCMFAAECIYIATREAFRMEEAK